MSQLRVTAGPDGAIRRLEIEELDGSRNRFDFAGEEANAPATPGSFVFQTPPGTHVVTGEPPI